MSTADTQSNPSAAAYPIRRSEEHRCSRRAFAKFVGVSLVAVTGGYLLKDTLLTEAQSGPRKAVAPASALQVGDSKLFTYPESQPCILIRLSESEYVAYSQSCTHLMCPVHYNKATQQLVCPCHEGYFNAKDGSVIAGPPPRPLPRYKVSVEDGYIVVG